MHSDRGTFDWLLEDAFLVGGRVGIAANSDGHKGRQGASHAGASLFGAYGGLTCYLAGKRTLSAGMRSGMPMLCRAAQYARRTSGALPCASRRVGVRLIMPVESRAATIPGTGSRASRRVTEAGYSAILTHVADTEI